MDTTEEEEEEEEVEEEEEEEQQQQQQQHQQDKEDDEDKEGGGEGKGEKKMQAIPIFNNTQTHFTVDLTKLAKLTYSCSLFDVIKRKSLSFIKH